MFKVFLQYIGDWLAVIGEGLKIFFIRVAGFFALFFVLYLAVKGYESWGNLCFSHSCQQNPASSLDYVKAYGTEIGVVFGAAVALPLIAVIIAVLTGLLKMAGVLLALVIGLAFFSLVGWGIYSAFEAYGFVHGLGVILITGVVIWLMQFIDFFSTGAKYKPNYKHRGFDSSGLPGVPVDSSPNPFANPDPSRSDGGNPYANP